MSEGGDEASLFGQGDKLIGWDEAVGGMLPACKGFDAVGLSSFEVHFRLIVESQFVMMNSVSQGCDEGQAVRAVLFIVSEVVESITFMSTFSSIHSDVGVAQKRYRIGTM